jgi:hypothetical protein
MDGAAFTAETKAGVHTPAGQDAKKTLREQGGVIGGAAVSSSSKGGGAQSIAVVV